MWPVCVCLCVCEWECDAQKEKPWNMERHNDEKYAKKIKWKQRVQFGYFSLPFLCCSFDWELHSKLRKKCAHKAQPNMYRLNGTPYKNTYTHIHKILFEKNLKILCIVVMVAAITTMAFGNGSYFKLPNNRTYLWRCGQKIVILEQSISKMWHIKNSAHNNRSARSRHPYLKTDKYVAIKLIGSIWF